MLFYAEQIGGKIERQVTKKFWASLVSEIYSAKPCIHKRKKKKLGQLFQNGKFFKAFLWPPVWVIVTKTDVNEQNRGYALFQSSLISIWEIG